MESDNELKPIKHLCENCTNFVHNGDRCEVTQGVVYISGGEKCSHFSPRKEVYDERV